MSPESRRPRVRFLEPCDGGRAPSTQKSWQRRSEFRRRDRRSGTAPEMSPPPMPEACEGTVPAREPSSCLTCTLQASWLHVQALQPMLPIAAARGRCHPCPELRLRPESQPPRIPCILPERRWHGGTTDDAAILAAPSTPVRHLTKPGSDATHPAEDSSAWQGSSCPRTRSGAPLCRQHRSQSNVLQTWFPPAYAPHRDTRRLLFRILRSRRAKRP